MPDQRRAGRHLEGRWTSSCTSTNFGRGQSELYDRRLEPYQLGKIYSTADPALLGAPSSRLDQLADCAAAGFRAAEEEP